MAWTMIDWTGVLAIGLIAATMIVAALACGLARHRGSRADGSAPPPDDPTRAFRDPSR